MTSPAASSSATVFLVGFMGSGKTTIGRLLAQRMAWKFIDLDAIIEQEEGATIAEIFARAGEARFRQREQELLRRIVADAPRGGGRVVALGGGTFAQQSNLELLRSAQAVTIWLECPVDELLMRCALVSNRPLFRDEASFRHLYEERLPFYRQATYTVQTGPGDPQLAVQQILALPFLAGSSRQAENSIPHVSPRT
jgi:shikimate kinase